MKGVAAQTTYIAIVLLAKAEVWHNRAYMVGVGPRHNCELIKIKGAKTVYAKVVLGTRISTNMSNVRGRPSDAVRLN